MAKNKSPKIVTKKHLARQERERKQTRLITGIAIGIIALVILGIAYGLLNDTLFLNWRPAVTVNGESLNLQEFQARVRVTRQQLINQYMQYEQLAQMFGMDPTTDPQLSQTLNQITSELNNPTNVGSQVITDMTNMLIIRQYAKANGIVVSAADVENASQHALNYYPSGTPTLTLTPTTLVYATLNPTQLALITPTPTPTAAPSSTPAPSATPFSTPTPNLTSTKTPIPTITPTATPYTLQGYQSQFQKAFSNYAQLGLTQAEFSTIFFEDGLYQDRVKAKITANVTHSQERVWARIIELADQATAMSVRSQLTNGADFGALVTKDSIDTTTKSNGGDLGWFGKDSTAVPAEVITSAFALKIGDISQPIQTTTGYEIIQVLGHEVRPLTDSEYQTALTNAFDTWLQKQTTASKVVVNNAWTSYVPTNPTLAQAQANDAATATAYVATYSAKNGGQ